MELTPKRATELAEQVREISPEARVFVSLFPDTDAEGAPSGSRIRITLSAPNLSGLIEQTQALADLIEREDLRYDEADLTGPDLVLRHPGSTLL